MTTELLLDGDVIRAMIKYGGGFVKALGEAALRADKKNLHLIKTTWPEYWEEYSNAAKVTNGKTI